MTNRHPVTPPPELVQQWDDEGTEMFRPEYQLHLATRAAQWGADQELEACCEWFQEFYKYESWVMHDLKHLRTVRRRPKPPSLKEQALKELQMAYDTSDISMVHLDTIRRALEALPE